MAKCQAWQEPSLRSPQTQAGRGAECLKVSRGLRMAILRLSCSGDTDKQTPSARSPSKARQACILPSKWYAISRGGYPSITVVKSRHAVGGAQHERSRAPQTAAREGSGREFKKPVPFDGLSTAPEDRCPDCKTYLLGSGRRLERIDTVGKAQVESSEAGSGDASENNRPV